MKHISAVIAGIVERPAGLPERLELRAPRAGMPAGTVFEWDSGQHGYHAVSRDGEHVLCFAAVAWCLFASGVLGRPKVTPPVQLPLELVPA